MTRYMVWGASDDLIEIREMSTNLSIRNGEEFSVYDTSKESPVELHFSDGTILNVWYGDDEGGAIWRVEVKEQGTVGSQGAGIVIVPAESEDGEFYSDIAFVTSPDLKFVKALCEGEEVLL